MLRAVLTHSTRVKKDPRLAIAPRICRLPPPAEALFSALNLGGGYGVGTKWGIALHPKVAFYYKERSDRAFVVRYRRNTSKKGAYCHSLGCY